MLVLSRKSGEDIVMYIPPSDVPQQIVMKLCDIRCGGKHVTGTVRLGFDAPRHVSIRRAEVDEEQDRGAEKK